MPVLWDKKERTIVSNESADIIRMFNSAFDDLGAKAGDYYPERQRAEIDEINSRIYADFNNGVYAAGFAGSQAAYEAAVEKVFDTLEWLERRLSDRHFLLGDNLTEADIRLFTTLIRLMRSGRLSRPIVPSIAKPNFVVVGADAHASRPKFRDFHGSEFAHLHFSFSIPKFVVDPCRSVRRCGPRQLPGGHCCDQSGPRQSFATIKPSALSR